MAKLVAIYNIPKDPQAFDDYYFSKHVPLANKIPGLKSNEVSIGSVSGIGGKSSYHRVAMLGFDSVEAIQNALTSPEGQATAADLANFADAGVELLIFDTKELLKV